MNPHESNERRYPEERDFQNRYPEDNYHRRERINNPFRDENEREDRWSDHPAPYRPRRDEYRSSYESRPYPERNRFDQYHDERERYYRNHSIRAPHNNQAREWNDEDRYRREESAYRRRNPHFEDMGGGDFYERAAGRLRNVRQELEHPEWCRNDYPQEDYPPQHHHRRRHEDEENWRDGDNPYMGDTLFF
jgi:hypothetical protein